MRGIKCYNGFASISHRILIFLVIPLTVLVMQLAFYKVLGVVGVQPVYVSFLVAAETVLDFWVFGGFTEKDFEGWDFIKCSKRGIQTLRSAIVFDNVRRFIWIAGTLALTIYIDGKRRQEGFWNGATFGLEEVALFFAMVFLAYGISMLLITVSRYTSLLLLILIGVYVAMLPIMLLCVLSYRYPVVLCAISGIIALAISILSVWNIMRKVKGSFYNG